MIPKIIHYCWFGNSPMSELEQKCIDSWKKYCPDYEIKLWNESNINIGSVDYMREAYEAKAWGFVPDVARLQIIYEYGGIYLDTDVELIKPLDDLLEEKAFLGQEDNCYVALGLGFGAEKGNLVIKRLLDDYTDRHFILESGELDRTPSPSIQSQCLAKLGYKPSKKKQIIEGVTIYPSEYMCPMSYQSGNIAITDNTFSIHHYEASWCSEEEKLEIAIYREFLQKYGRLGVALFKVHSFLIITRKYGILQAINWILKTIHRKILYLVNRDIVH